MTVDDYRILKREYGDGRVVYVVQNKEYPDYSCASAYWADFKERLSVEEARDELNKILKNMIIREMVLK